MFKKRKKYLYQQILQADPRACQVRTIDNRILYTNALGTLLFGTNDNPFEFLIDTADTQNLENLELAYKKHQAHETIISTKNKVFEIKLAPLYGGILITVLDQTASQKTYKALENQLEMLSETIKNLTIPLFLADIHQNIVYANPTFLQELQLELSQIIGHNYIDLFQTPKPKGWDILPIEVRQEDLLLGIKKIKVAEQLSSNIEDLPVPTLLLAPDNHKIVGFNKAFTQIFNLTPNEIIDSNFDLLWDKASQSILKSIKGQLSDLNKDLTCDLKTQESDLHFRAIWGHQNKLLTCVLFDITPRKKLEKQIVQDQKMQALGQLTGGIAHDFNNILTAILGFTDLLLEKTSATDPSFLDIMQIKGNAQKAASLVGQLLTFSRKTPLQAKLISVHDAFVDITPLLQRSLAPLCTLKIEMKKNLGSIRLDANQLTQILLNLSVNAKDAMKNGGIFKMTVSYEKVKKSRPFFNSTIPSGDYIKITTTDTGSGIPPEILPHIFDPFFTTKEKTQASGTGLGLSTVYGIINSAGGFVGVDSEQNVGTTFTIYLPRFEEEPNKIIDSKKTLPHIFLPDQKGKIILADDEDGIRTIIKRALSVKGFEVMECQNADQALDLLKTNNDIQLLITDMLMPGMDGEHLIQNAQKLHPQLKAILMSGYSNEFERHTSKRKMPFTFLAKPFVLNELLDIIQKVLRD